MDAFLAQFYKVIIVVLLVVLGLTGTYAGWLHFVTVPVLRADAKEATANAAIWESNTKTCEGANKGFVASIDKQNAAIEALALLFKTDQAELRGILAKLGVTLRGVPTALAAYKPDPRKSDCENAKNELALFKQERSKP